MCFSPWNVGVDSASHSDEPDPEGHRTSFYGGELLAILCANLLLNTEISGTRKCFSGHPSTSSQLYGQQLSLSNSDSPTDVLTWTEGQTDPEWNEVAVR